MRALSSKENLPLHVESCGTHDYHVGEVPDLRSQEHARRRGYELSAKRARRVSVGDFGDFDLILAMDRGHLRILRRLCPEPHRAKLRLFLGSRDVPDPYYGGAEAFEEVLDLVESACTDLLQELRRVTS